MKYNNEDDLDVTVIMEVILKGITSSSLQMFHLRYRPSFNNLLIGSISSMEVQSPHVIDQITDTYRSFSCSRRTTNRQVFVEYTCEVTRIVHSLHSVDVRCRKESFVQFLFQSNFSLFLVSLNLIVKTDSYHIRNWRTRLCHFNFNIYRQLRKHFRKLRR